MERTPRIYGVRRLPEPLPSGGSGDEAAWSGIPSLRVEQPMGRVPDFLPTVQAKVAWEDGFLDFLFRVEDRHVRAVARRHQDPVCRDSCVEFFFTPGTRLGHSYFNLEVNCGGTVLFWWHPEGQEALPVAAGDLDRLDIKTSLPKIVDPEIQEPTVWMVEGRLPFEVIRRYCPEACKPGPGVVWKANFYKCADGTSNPHWLTWSFVDHPVPKFHLPQYFGTLEFRSE